MSSTIEIDGGQVLLQIMEIKKAIEDSSKEQRKVMEKGFEELKRELQLGREQGHIPITVLEKMLESNNSAYKEMIHNNNLTYKSILKTICWMMVVLLGWVTGMKYFLPDNPITNNKTVIEALGNAE
jgi:hypothetical protein